MIGKAKSITHQHLLSILNTETSENSEGRILKLLDIGCGNGHFIGYIMRNFAELNPAVEFEIYGFDVNDHGVQSEGYFSNTIKSLSVDFPDIAWDKRLHVISDKDLWPCPDGFFDVIISNQVVEHVLDHDLFFSEINRTLCTGGCSIHLFPLKHYFYEGHLYLPLVHRILNHDFTVAYIKFLSRLGLGKYKSHKKISSVSLDEYAERHADYMCFFTNYLSYLDALSLGKRHSLRASFRYTQEFYTGKLRSLLGFEFRYKYQRNRSGLVDWLAIHILKYVSSITLVLHKNETYTSK